MKIEEKSQWRHKERHERKVRVTKVYDTQFMQGVSFDIHDPERNQQPWRDSTTLATLQFLATYEPELPAHVVIQDQATELVAELIAKVEANVAPELVALRARQERVLAYLEHVTAPNMHMVSHIRRMLTTDNEY